MPREQIEAGYVRLIAAAEDEKKERFINLAQVMQEVLDREGKLRYELECRIKFVPKNLEVNEHTIHFNHKYEKKRLLFKMNRKKSISTIFIY